jgi:hypothetical protein
VTVAEDSVMIIYNPRNLHKPVKKLDLDHELYAIASNSMDKLAIGGEKEQVDIVQMCGEGENMDSVDDGFVKLPILAMKFHSAIQRIMWVGKFILGISEDSSAQLYDTETEKVYTFK